MVRNYEALYILDPLLTEEETTEQIDRFSQFVETHGGSVENAARWEKRKLAYEIKGRREGSYILMTFKGGANLPSELDRAFKLSEPVLRGLITKVEQI
ncbi:MAG TPA: 30S ribosomal protein S6 [Armatimonadota bacterium]|nr:30S ribosomal protein S6 [Armatimonadota bacterium]